MTAEYTVDHLHRGVTYRAESVLKCSFHRAHAAWQTNLLAETASSLALLSRT